jgi:hypothetical protein
MLRELIGVAAVIALGVRAAMEWRAGTGWPYLLIAAALGAALVLRRRYPRV